MLKYPIFLQDSENSCGAYCIKMLLNFYKRDDEIKNIKKRYHPTTMIVIENDEDYQLFKTDHKDIQAAGELMKVKKVSV